MRGSEWLAAQIVRKAAEAAAKDGGKDTARDAGETGLFRTWISRFHFARITTDVAADVLPPVTDDAGENAGEAFERTWNAYWDTIAAAYKDSAGGEPGGTTPDPE